MYGNNSEYEYCLWSFAARSIKYGNNGEYEYCLWSYASEVRGAERRKQPKARETGCHFDRAYSIMYGNNSEYEYCFWSFAARSIMFGNNSEYEYCLWSFASELASGAEKSSLYRKDRFLDYARNDGIMSYLFGCNAKPPPQPTHDIRQAFGLRSK